MMTMMIVGLMIHRWNNDRVYVMYVCQIFVVIVVVRSALAAMMAYHSRCWRCVMPIPDGIVLTVVLLLFDSLNLRMASSALKNPSNPIDLG